MFDWNHDGQWGGSTTCNVEDTERQVAEWGIQNLALHEAPYNLEPGFQGKITLPAVTTGALPGDLWMRLTVTSTPVDTERFTPALQGGQGWTGQGNFEYGESEDYLTCLIFDADKPLEGCPAPLTTQQPIDPPPGATTPDAVDDEVDTSPSDGIEVDVLANDEDPADQPLRITQTSNAANGTVSVNPDGTVSYTPDAGFTGTDQFTYTVCDPDGSCDTATVIVNVAQTNSPPVADDDEATTLEGSETTVDVLDNDIDPDGDSLSIVGNTEPANGSISCTESVCSYTPDDGFVGTDSFTYTVSDGNGGTDTATATITVNDVNSPPTAQDATVTTDEDTPVDVDLVCTDPDGNPLSFAITDGPDQGTLSGSGDARTYTPADDVNGTDT
ncbi:MAG: cadherin-like domain-containing protein, partial [Candidatus Bipolaricaulia bacterium]